MSIITENDIELYTIEELQRQGNTNVYAPSIAPEALLQERQSFREALLVGRLRLAIQKLNRHIPYEAQEQALNILQRIVSCLFLKKFMLGISNQ